MMQFTDHQSKVLKVLFQSCFEAAAAAFSKMTGTKIEAGSIHIFLTDQQTKVYPCHKSHPELTVLLTPMIGKLSGKSYFIMDPHDAETLCNWISRGSVSKMNLRMTEAFFKELDNILSAAAITQLSNTLNQEIYGDVPELLYQSPVGVNEHVHYFSPNGQINIVVQGSFVSPGAPEFNPLFIWKVSSQLLNDVLHINLEKPGTANLLKPQLAASPTHITNGRF